MGQPEHIKVLDRDPDLLAAVPPSEREAARAGLTAPALSLPRGPWDAEELAEPGAVGMLILEGLMTRNVEIAETDSREPLGAGDIIRPWDDRTALDPIPARTTWSVIEPVVIVLLDRRWRLVSARWPELGDEILHRVMRRSRWLSVLLAIAARRGVEGRLKLLLWHLAGSWGRVTPEGTLVPFRLTHELMGDLIGARRPSVTTAIAEMEREGVVERVDEGWLLRGGPPVSDA